MRNLRNEHVCKLHAVIWNIIWIISKSGSSKESPNRKNNVIELITLLFYKSPKEITPSSTFCCEIWGWKGIGWRAWCGYRMNHQKSLFQQRPRLTDECTGKLSDEYFSVISGWRGGRCSFCYVIIFQCLIILVENMNAILHIYSPYRRWGSGMKRKPHWHWCWLRMRERKLLLVRVWHLGNGNGGVLE